MAQTTRLAFALALSCAVAGLAMGEASAATTVPPVHRMGAGPAPAAAPAGAHLAYFGGSVISRIQVVQVLYGGTQSAYASQVWATASPSLASFYAGVTNSAYFDWLVEYDTPSAGGTGQTIGRGAFLAQRHIVPSAANDGSVISDLQIEGEIAAQIAAGALPAPTSDAAGNPNTVYMINFPRGKTITLGPLTSCTSGGFCAYHQSFASNGQTIVYGVLPDMGPTSACSLGCGANPVEFNDQTAVASHELIEAVTDPVPTLGWYDPNNGEIGDICNQQQGTVVGGDGLTYVVQKEFSNLDDACIVTRPASVAVAPAVGGAAPWLAAALLLAGAARSGARATARR